MDGFGWAVAVFGALVLGAFGKWVAWSAKQGVKEVIAPLGDRVDQLSSDLRSHMAEEKVTTAVNYAHHEEFRRRITALEEHNR